MPKRKPNEEIFLDGDREIHLVADWGFMYAVNSYGKDISVIYRELSEGLTNPEDIRNVLIAAARDIDEGAEAIFERLIEKYGLQECGVMAQIMVSHAVIGDEKKRAIARGEAIKSLLERMGNSRSMSLKKVGVLLAATWLISLTAACTISNLFMMHIV